MPSAKQTPKANKSLVAQKAVAWAVLVIGILYIVGTAMGSSEVPASPPNPLGMLLTAGLLITLPLIWLQKINKESGKARFLSGNNSIIVVTLLAIAISAYGFWGDTKRYFVTQDELVSQKFAAVNVVYQKRFDLVPNVAKSAKALADQEKAIVNNITSARTKYLDTQNTDQKAQAVNDFNRALISLNVENYPNLKSDSGFVELIKVLNDTEAQLVTAKNDYNQQVTILNSQSRSFPQSLWVKYILDEPIKTRLNDTADSQMQNAKDLLKDL